MEFYVVVGESLGVQHSSSKFLLEGGEYLKIVFCEFLFLLEYDSQRLMDF